VGGQVLAGLQRGICRVADVRCPRPQPPEADLAPCPVWRNARGELLSTTIAIVRLGTSGTLSSVRGSDGRVTITLAHGNDVGAEVGVGARLRTGGGSLGGSATAGAGVAWTSGRSWTFADEGAARRFVSTYGSKATIGGQFVDDVRSHCSLLCDALGWNPHAELPEPDAVYAEGGPTAALTASLGAASASVKLGALLGRELRRDGARTWYLKLDAEATAGLRLPGAELVASAGDDAVLAYELDAQGRPRALHVSLAGRLGASATVEVEGSAGGTVGGGRGLVGELEATLDLRDPANRATAAALLDALAHPESPSGLFGSARALGERIGRHGQVDRRVYTAREDTSGVGASIALGAKLGGGLDRTTSGLRLLSAATRLPGLPFLPRDDCRTA
jgi:hypothetical protein